MLLSCDQAFLDTYYTQSQLWHLFLDGEKDNKCDFICLLSELFKCWSTAVKSFPQLCYYCINSGAILWDSKNFHEIVILQMSKIRIASEHTQISL